MIELMITTYLKILNELDVILEWILNEFTMNS